jgi:hypothetical protein
MNHRRHITAATLALALLGTAAPALAADSLTTRVFHSLLPHNPAEQARTEPETESADDMPVSNH